MDGLSEAGMAFCTSFAARTQTMQKRIHKLLFYTLLLSAYAGFFSVESFFNFEGQTEVRTTQSAVRTKKAPSPLQSAHTHLVRLNKRYHQEDISLCPVIYAEAPVTFVVPSVVSLYRDYPLLSGLPIQPSLRGPPYIA
jgi:hypothetical protein